MSRVVVRLTIALTLILSTASFSAASQFDIPINPLAFEQNAGQAGEPVRYVARGPGYRIEIAPAEFSIAGHSSVVRMKLAGGRSDVALTASEELRSHSNYFVGNDQSKWRTDVPNFGQVHARGVYKGVDVVYYGTEGKLEYDFTVSPATDPSVITMTVEGGHDVRLSGGGVVIATADGEMTVHKPVVYQIIAGQRREIPAEYVLAGDAMLKFSVGAYDHSQPLVIDPIVTFLPLFNANQNGTSFGLALGPQATPQSNPDIYITGETPDAVGTVVPAGSSPVGVNVFVARYVFNTGQNQYARQFLSVIGGSDGIDSGAGIAVTASAGTAWVVGRTSSSNFPLAKNTKGTGTDGFLLALNAAGNTITSSRYVGGNGEDRVDNVALDGAGNVYVAGVTKSTDLKSTALNFPGSVLGTDYNGFVAQFDSTGTPGGTPSGGGYVNGGTILGGPFLNTGSTQYLYIGLSVTSAGDAYITGGTNADLCPTGAACQAKSSASSDSDVVVMHLNPTGAVLAVGYVGGTNHDYGRAITVSAGTAYVTGTTHSIDVTLPACGSSTCPPAQSRADGDDAFIAILDSDLNLAYFTYLGNTSGTNNGTSIALDSTGNVMVGGDSGNPGSSGTDLPAAVGVRGSTTDGFVSKYSPSLNKFLYSTFVDPAGQSTDDNRIKAIAAATVATNGFVYVTGFTTVGSSTPVPWLGQVDESQLLQLVSIQSFSLVDPLTLLPPAIPLQVGDSTRQGDLIAKALIQLSGPLNPLDPLSPQKLGLTFDTPAIAAGTITSVSPSSCSNCWTVDIKLNVNPITLPPASDSVTNVTATLTNAQPKGPLPLHIRGPKVTIQVLLSQNPVPLPLGQTLLTATVTFPPLIQPAILNLATSNPDVVTVGAPATVSLGTGSTGATFTLNPVDVPADSMVDLNATLTFPTAGNALRSGQGTFTVQARVIGISAIQVGTPITGGQSGTGTIVLTGPVQAGATNGLTISVSSGDPTLGITTPSVIVPANGTQANFSFSTSVPTQDTGVAITAATSGSTLTRTVKVVTTAPVLKLLIPPAIAGGATATGTLSLVTSQSGNFVITLASNSPFLTLPQSSVTIPAGGTSAPFTIQTTLPGANTPVTISATYSSGVVMADTIVMAVKQATITTLPSILTPALFGQPVSFTATVSPAVPGVGIPTGTVTFRDGNTLLGTATVNAGQATLSNITGLSVGVHSITATYGGSAAFNGSASAASSLIIYAFPAGTGGGDFVIGNLSATVGKPVTFWGAQWAKSNSLSGGSASSSFKGFANSTSVKPPTTGSSWSTSPGNSSGPPNSVPAYMAVIVSSSVTKSGSNITGNVVHMAVVKTDPGYQSDPGHAGTGTVVAVIQ